MSEEEVEFKIKPKSGWDEKKPTTAFDTSIGVQQKKQTMWDIEAEIIVLPDAGDEEMVERVSEPPKEIGHTLQGLQFFNEAIEEGVPSSLEGVDLSLLTNVLRGMEDLLEPDTLWEYKYLQAEITQEYHKRFEEYHEKEPEEDSKYINRMPTQLE